MIFDVFLALGSNIGDREKNLVDAVINISAIKGTKLLKVSNIYETEPVGYTEQDKFLNLVINIETDIEPRDLLTELQRIEGLLKRRREMHWGPRTIDLDILLYGDSVIDLPELTVPHTRMLERAFVMVPLRDVYSKCKIFGKNIDVIINECPDKDGVKYFKKFKIKG
jgi:2-amino-4-hydroxy-6-hydroxymethyldihydropteridine diphosphokinase